MGSFFKKFFKRHHHDYCPLPSPNQLDPVQERYREVAELYGAEIEPLCEEKSQKGKKSVKIVLKPPPKPATPRVRQFQVSLDLSQFDESEISVKQFNRKIIVQCKHEEEDEESGHYELHQYVRKVPVPENCLMEQLKCKLFQCGNLRIEIPMKPDVSEEKAD